MARTDNEYSWPCQFCGQPMFEPETLCDACWYTLHLMEQTRPYFAKPMEGRQENEQQQPGPKDKTTSPPYWLD